MKNKIVKERIIFNNYDLSDMYDDAKECLIDNGIEDPSDDTIWNEIYDMSNSYWDDEMDMIKEFDKNFNKYLMVGEVGRWDGVFSGGKVFNTLQDAIYYAIKDCDYIKLYDENGVFKIHCSHHDGSCSFMIKAITDDGMNYLDRWEYNWNDKRNEAYIHTQIIKRYSKNLNFAHNVYGCKLREYEPMTKGELINKLNNNAHSFYC